MKRFVKQILYGLLFLSVLGVFEFAVYLAFFRSPIATCFDDIKNQGEENVDCGGECIPCELKDLSLSHGDVMTFPVSSSNSIVLVEVLNPSANYGLRKMDYNFGIFSKFGGVRLATIVGSTTVGPSERKYIAEPVLDIPHGDISVVEFKVLNSNWEEKALLPRAPQVSLTYSKALEKSSVPTGRILRGEVSLESVLPVNVTLTAIGFGERGNILGVSTTRIEGLVSGVKKQFSILLREADYKDVRVFYDS